MHSLLARCLGPALALLVLALPAAAEADTPPAPTCFYYVAGCDATYGTPNSSSTRVVAVDEEVTIDTGYNPVPPFGTPFNPTCLEPGSLGTCVYSNVAWLFSVGLGFGTTPYAILGGCGGDNTSCTFRFSPRGIGNDGDVWQTLVAAHRIGTTVIKDKKGYAIYAPPRWRWARFNATGAVNHLAGTAYAVRSGTNPTFGSCVDVATINATTSTTAHNCLKTTGSSGSGQNPSWRFPLPAGSTWKVLFNPIVRSEAGPAAVPAVQERWVSANAAVGQSDITQTVSPRPRGTLTAVIDTGGPTIQINTNRLITVTATAKDGWVENAGWDATVFTRTGSAIGLAYVNDESGTLLPGEKVVGTSRITAPSSVPASPTSTFASRVRWRSATSASRDLFVDATPAAVTVVRDPVPPPPPPPGPGATVPKPPIPVSASPSLVTGRVADAPLTSYVVTWFTASSCDATDATATLVGTTIVATDGAGGGDASVAPSPAPAAGAAVFGYSTLNGARSVRSACIAVPVPETPAAPPPAAGGPFVPISGAVLPTVAAPTLKLTLPKGGVKRGRRVTLKVAIRGAAGGSVALRRGRTKLASAKVVKGVATLKVRFTKARKERLALVYTPAGGGKATTRAVTLTVTR
ncbi:MAG: hypothetical protein JHC84_00725 [Solirubrobacteraceae bacterium]|nr:hypothetical protein [Solirubrobacteraceae bacterium]